MAGENFPQGRFRFTGISNVVGGVMTYSRGITPGVCLLRTVPEPRLDSQIGTLYIDYNDITISFPYCAVNTHSLRREKDRFGEFYWQIQILDRRWAWAYKKISGEYNVRMPDDTVRYSDTNHPELRKNLRELAELCLQAMGESNYNVSMLPVDVWPYVNWKNVNPAMELQALCDLVSCVIVYDWRDDATKIWQLGVGDQLPTGPFAVNPVLPVSVSRRPDNLVVECWPTKFQLKFELEAVGMDTDGKIKKLEDLSYKPTPDKWQYDWWCAFPGVAVVNRHLAYKTVFRWYRIKGLASGGLLIPGVSEQIKSIDQYELEDGLVEIAKDFDEMPQTRPTLMEGEFWPQCPWQVTTDKSAVYNNAGYRVLPEHKNVIEFPYPVLKINTGGTYEPATLYLTTRCIVRKEDGDWYVSENFTRQLPWQPSGAGSRILKHPELWKYHIQAYTNTSSAGSVTTNDTALEAEAKRYLDFVQQEYLGSAPEDRGYAFINPLSLDGAIAQLQWRAGHDLPAQTRASRNHEFDIFTPSYQWRRRYEKVDSLADRELL